MTYLKGEFFDPWCNSNLKPTVETITGIEKSFKLEYLNANACVVPQDVVNYQGQIL
jgi:hypothetical protein